MSVEFALVLQFKITYTITFTLTFRNVRIYTQKCREQPNGLVSNCSRKRSRTKENENYSQNPHNSRGALSP